MKSTPCTIVWEFVPKGDKLIVLANEMKRANSVIANTIDRGFYFV